MPGHTRLAQEPEEEPQEAVPPPRSWPPATEQDELLGKKVPTQLQVVTMTLFTFPMSVIWSTMGMVVLPAEALYLFPRKESLYLGFFLAVVGLSQLVCPVAGLLSDRCRSRWGRRRPFICVGTLSCLASIAGMWATSVQRMPGNFFLTLFCSQASLNVIDVAQRSIVPDIQREKMGEVSGTVASLQLAGQLFGMFWIICSSEQDFHHMYGVYLVMLLSAGVIVCGTTRERPTDQDVPVPLTWQDIRKSYWLDLQGDRDFFWIFVGRALFYMATAVQTFIYYYLRDLMGVAKEEDIRFRLGVLALIATFVGLAATYPLGKLSDRVGRKLLVYLACFFMGLAYAGYTVCPLLGPYYGMAAAYGLGGFYGLGLGGYLSVDYALAIDCLPEKHKGSSEALGLWGIAGFLGSSFGPLVGGVLLETLGGLDRDEGQSYTYSGYVPLLLLGSTWCMLSAMVTGLVVKAK